MTKKLLLLTSLVMVGCLVPPDTPEPFTPSEVRRQITESLTGADKADCLTVYGVYSAAARYVGSDQLDADNTVELRKQVKRATEIRGWEPGKYADFSEVLPKVLDPVLKENKPVFDRRAEIVELFEQVAAGALEASK